MLLFEWLTCGCWKKSTVGAIKLPPNGRRLRCIHNFHTTRRCRNWDRSFIRRLNRFSFVVAIRTSYKILLPPILLILMCAVFRTLVSNYDLVIFVTGNHEVWRRGTAAGISRTDDSPCYLRFGYCGEYDTWLNPTFSSFPTFALSVLAGCCCQSLPCGT